MFLPNRQIQTLYYFRSCCLRIQTCCFHLLKTMSLKNHQMSYFHWWTRLRHIHHMQEDLHMQRCHLRRIS